MIRYILCPACAERFSLHPEDAADGWSMLKVPIKARRPDNHQITIQSGAETSIIPVPVMVCDFGNEEILDGTDCIAVSMCKQGEDPQWWWREFSQP